MLYIDQVDQTIKLTRGDTGKLTISILNEDTKEPYDLKENDKLTLSLKKSAKDETPVMQKVVTGVNQIVIEPSDTKNLKFGQYRYDVQLDMENGEVYTVIEDSIFEIATEITC